MSVLSTPRAISLRGSQNRAGYKVRIAMANPRQPGAMITLGVLQCSAMQWFLLRELVKVGGSACGVAVTIVTGDVPTRLARRPMASEVTR